MAQINSVIVCYRDMGDDGSYGCRYDNAKHGLLDQAEMGITCLATAF